MASVTWLHLADLHFKSGIEFEQFNRKTVLDALWCDIGTQASAGFEPDFIVFTGDVAYHGRKEEYELAVEYFFEPLLHTTGVSKDRLFIVPGNHDVNWDEIDPVAAHGMFELLKSRDEINSFLSGEQDRSYYFQKFTAYGDFINTYLGGALSFSHDNFFYTQNLRFYDTNLAILGLNSAWMSGCVKDSQSKAQDKGNLLIGELQLGKALESTKGADLHIAILHHPLDWLHEVEQCDMRNRLEAQCDILLYGHLHMPRLQTVDSTAGQATYIPVGAIYESRDFLNGYNFVRLDLASGKGTVFLRRYNDKGPRGAEWIKDIQSTGEKRDGTLEFYLPQREEVSPIPADKKVLLAEDGPDWQRALQSILLPPAFDLQIARTFAEAIGKLQRESYDLILVNLCLEDDRDWLGVAILDALQDRLINNPPPCIVLTGTGGSTRGLYDRYNVRDVFFKGQSFDKANFLRRVNEVIGS